MVMHLHEKNKRASCTSQQKKRERTAQCKNYEILLSRFSSEKFREIMFFWWKLKCNEFCCKSISRNILQVRVKFSFFYTANGQLLWVLCTFSIFWEVFTKNGRGNEPSHFNQRSNASLSTHLHCNKLEVQCSWLKESFSKSCPNSSNRILSFSKLIFMFSRWRCTITILLILWICVKDGEICLIIISFHLR